MFNSSINRQLLKTLWEKKKMLVTNIFPVSMFSDLYYKKSYNLSKFLYTKDLQKVKIHSLNEGLIRLS